MRRLAQHLQGKTHVIWDWNGTLLDDVAVCVEIISDIAKSHGIDAVPLTRYLQVFRFPVVEYYKDVGFDFAKTPFEELTRQFIAGYRAKAHRAPLFGGARELLLHLESSGIRSSVLSAAHETDLHAMLEHHGIKHHFAHVFGLGDHFAASKVERGHQLLKALGRPARDLVLVGDTDHDLEVGRDLGIDVLLVDGGHQHLDRLKSRHTWVVSRAARLAEPKS